MIDADAYKMLHCKECPSDCGACSLVYGKDDICGLIDKAPTIDAVPVVRCKDCKYSSYDSELNDAMICTRTNDGYWRHGNDFCSYGERKVNK